MICESEKNKTHKKNTLLKKSSRSFEVYCADKNIKYCDNKTSFKNFNTCTDPGI